MTDFNLLPKFSIVVCHDAHLGIGKDNSLAWHIPGDMKFFKELTIGGTVIMGRKAFESIPEKYRPLPDRQNIVLSGSQREPLGEEIWVNSLDEALEKADRPAIFVIGGRSIYEMALTHPLVDSLIITELKDSYDCNVFFPDYRNKNGTEQSQWRKVKTFLQTDEFVINEYKLK